MANHDTTSLEDPWSHGQHWLGRPWQWRYGVAVACVAIGWAARETLTAVVGPTAVPFVFFFPAVAVAAWCGGLGAGVLAAGLASIAALYFFIEPTRSFSAHGWPDAAAVFAFLLSCAFIIAAVDAMHRSRRQLVHGMIDRDRMTADLAHARDSLATTLVSIGDGVIVTDAAGRVTFLNPEAERLTGWTRLAAAGRPLSEVFHLTNEYSHEPMENPVDKVFRAGHAVGLADHAVLLAKDGTERPVGDSAAPIRPGQGEPLGVVLVFRDVTAQRKAEATRMRLATIVEFSGDAIFTKTLDGTIESWNAGAERLFAYTAAEIIGQSITRLVPPEYLAEEHQILQRLCEGMTSQHIETVRLAKDGRRLAVSVSVSPLRDGEGRVIGASTIIHDITARKEAEKEIERAKERLVVELRGMQRLHEFGTMLLKENDLPAMLRQVLAASLELLGAKKGIVQLCDRREQTLRIVAQIGFKEEFVQQFSAVSMDQDFASSIALQRRQRVIIEDFATDPSFAHLQAGAARHGIAAAQSTPLFAGDGEVFGILSTHFETAHRPSESELRLLDLYAQQAERVIDRHRSDEAVRDAQAELARANADLEKTVEERTAALRDMVNELEHVSYAITHDMRAPLRAMSAFAQRLLEDATTHRLSPDAQDYCRRIATGAGRLDILIREALNYTRAVLQPLPLGPVDLDPLIRGMLDTYPNFHPDKAEIQIEGRLPVVQGNESLLTQCFSNLLGNAVKFVAPGQKPRVQIWSHRSATVARITVRDHGIGIPRHAHARLFGMFQKLDTHYDGTGIGLAIVRKVVQRMHGTVDVDSDVGEGSRFSVELPIATAEGKP